MTSTFRGRGPLPNVFSTSRTTRNSAPTVTVPLWFAHLPTLCLIASPLSVPLFRLLYGLHQPSSRAQEAVKRMGGGGCRGRSRCSYDNLDPPDDPDVTLPGGPPTRYAAVGGHAATSRSWLSRLDSASFGQGLERIVEEQQNMTEAIVEKRAEDLFKYHPRVARGQRVN